MNWNDLTLNPKVIAGYYDRVPCLAKVEIFKLVLNRDASKLTIVFEPDRFPERPSQRWPLGANAVQVSMSAFGVKELEIHGWGSNIVGELSLEKQGPLIGINFEGPAQFRAVTEFIQVDKVVGYCSEVP